MAEAAVCNALASQRSEDAHADADADAVTADIKCSGEGAVKTPGPSSKPEVSMHGSLTSRLGAFLLSQNRADTHSKLGLPAIRHIEARPVAAALQFAERLPDTAHIIGHLSKGTWLRQHANCVQGARHEGPAGKALYRPQYMSGAPSNERPLYSSSPGHQHPLVQLKDAHALTAAEHQDRGHFQSCASQSAAAELSVLEHSVKASWSGKQEHELRANEEHYQNLLQTEGDLEAASRDCIGVCTSMPAGNPAAS